MTIIILCTWIEGHAGTHVGHAAVKMTSKVAALLCVVSALHKHRNVFK